MKNRKIILCGDGWGAISAYKSLIKKEFEVIVVSDDEYFQAKISDTILADFKEEIIVFAGYKPIVSKSILDQNTCINIHYSLLPTYRGLHSTVWAILNNEPKLGLTIHLMDEYIDNGAIIYQYEALNDFKKTATDFMELFNVVIQDNLGFVLNEFLRGNITPKQQNKSLASWVGKRNKKDCLVDFGKSISYQKAFFRALVAPYPLPFVYFKGNEYTVTKVDFHESHIETHLGRVLNIDDDGLWVKALDGYLIIKEMIDVNGHKIDLTQFTIGQYLK